MEQILKAARLEKAELNEEELALINQQTLRPLAAEEVFTFRLAACDNQVDRDFERFTEETLAEMAERQHPLTAPYRGTPVQIPVGRMRPCWNWNKTDFEEELT